MNLKDLMMLYGVTLSQRRTKKQKYLFATQIRETANNLGLAFNVVEHRMGRYTVENIMVGNPKASKYVVAIGYDTPTKSYVNCKYYPFHQELTIKNERKNIIVKAVISLVFLALAYLGFSLAKGKVLYYLAGGLALVISGLVLFVNGNKFNFNRYSASVALAVKLLEDLKGKDISVVFCDKITTGYDGYRLMLEHITSKSEVIVLDCVGYGEKLVVAHSNSKNDEGKKIAESLGAIDKSYSEDRMKNNVLSVLPECLFITSGEIENGELVVNNTRSKNDIKIDMNRLEKMEKVICEYMK